MEENKAMVIDGTAEEVKETKKEESKFKKMIHGTIDATKEHAPVVIGVTVGIVVLGAAIVVAKKALSNGTQIVSAETLDNVIDATEAFVNIEECAN